MARRPSKHLRPARPLSPSLGRTVTSADGRWQVRDIPAQRSEKPYLCPGCLHDIRPGQAHVVVWPVVPSIGLSSGVDERRHWHTACWNRRR